MQTIKAKNCETKKKQVAITKQKNFCKKVASQIKTIVFMIMLLVKICDFDQIAMNDASWCKEFYMNAMEDKCVSDL